MTKENTSKPKKTIFSRLTKELFRFKNFEAEKSYASFLAIYAVVAWLFLGRGVLEETLLVLFTGVMLTVGVALVVKFFRFLAKAADARDGKIGSLFVFYLLDFLVPLLGFRLFGYVINRVIPYEHDGLPQLLCDLYTMYRDLYYRIFDVAQNLELLILGSFIFMTILTVISILLPKRK